MSELGSGEQTLFIQHLENTVQSFTRVSRNLCACRDKKRMSWSYLVDRLGRTHLQNCKPGQAGYISSYSYKTRRELANLIVDQLSTDIYWHTYRILQIYVQLSHALSKILPMSCMAAGNGSVRTINPAQVFSDSLSTRLIWSLQLHRKSWKGAIWLDDVGR